MMISIGVIFTVLATLTTAALAEGSIECNFSERKEAQFCLGAVGQLLIFHLSNTSNTSIRLKKDNEYVILQIEKNQIVIRHEEYVNYSELVTNGAVTLGHAMKRHSGDYLLEEFKSDGVLLKTVNVHLQIQAPVSKPAVSQMCLSPELMNIRCSSEGDGLEFILTLNGILLMQTRGHSWFPSNRPADIESPTGSKTERDKPSVSDVSISFHGLMMGNLLCHVWNNVSRDETVFHLKGCKDFVSSFPVIRVAVTAAVSLLLLVTLCLGVLKCHNKQRSTTVNEGNAEDDVVYTSVRIIKNKRPNASESNLT